jgi:hypothetical protein
LSYRSTGLFPYGPDMVFEVTLMDGTVERVEGAESVVEEGRFTSFVGPNGNRTVDCWATTLASYRTANIAVIRRVSYLASGRRS